MNYNEFNNFVENYILELKNKNKSNDIRKVRVFASYIKKYSSENNCDILNLFKDLDGDFLLDSILSYITDETPIKNVAAEYRRIIVKFCKVLCEKYELKNEFLNDVAKQADFNKLSSEFFCELREAENINCLPFDKLEKIKNRIDYYLNMDNFEAAIINSIENPKCQSKYNYYNISRKREISRGFARKQKKNRESYDSRFLV